MRAGKYFYSLLVAPTWNRTFRVQQEHNSMIGKLFPRHLVKQPAFCLLSLVCATSFGDRLLGQEVTATTNNWETSKVTAVRKSASDRSEVVGTLAAFEPFTTTPMAENLWKIKKSNGLTGLIRKNEIEKGNAFSKSLEKGLPVWASPSNQSAVVATLAPGEEFTGFYQISPIQLKAGTSFRSFSSLISRRLPRRQNFPK
jgi:hypothetical protein